MEIQKEQIESLYEDAQREHTRERCNLEQEKKDLARENEELKERNDDMEEQMQVRFLLFLIFDMRKFDYVIIFTI